MEAFSGFYKKSLEERLEILADYAELSSEEKELLKKAWNGALGIQTADKMIENVFSCFELPFGIATNFKVNGKEIVVPMVLEEPSVVAAASKAAKLCLPEGFNAEAPKKQVMVGQIQIVGVKDFRKTKKAILKNKKELIEIANSCDKTLVSFGGGAFDLQIRDLGKKMIAVHLLVDVRDAMGANAVNTMCERITEKVEEMSGGKVGLRILSNLATERIVKARAVWKKEVIGEEAIEGILTAYEFAVNDVYRAVTHNKGVMNGIDAVLIATGNDFRAVEAGAHAFASLKGKIKRDAKRKSKENYAPLTKYYKDRKGDLVGEIELPLAIGIVGGTTKTHPLARIALKIMNVKKVEELQEIIASIGLAQNLAALLALSTVGIQQGHMKLHAKNIAISAGASGEKIELIAEKMVKEKKVSMDRAKEILKEL